jgi:hypothetical protein
VHVRMCHINVTYPVNLIVCSHPVRKDDSVLSCTICKLFMVLFRLRWILRSPHMHVYIRLDLVWKYLTHALACFGRMMGEGAARATLRWKPREEAWSGICP